MHQVRMSFRIKTQFPTSKNDISKQTGLWTLFVILVLCLVLLWSSTGQAGRRRFSPETLQDGRWRRAVRSYNSYNITVVLTAVRATCVPVPAFARRTMNLRKATPQMSVQPPSVILCSPSITWLLVLKSQSLFSLLGQLARFLAVFASHHTRPIQPSQTRLN